MYFNNLHLGSLYKRHKKRLAYKRTSTITSCYSTRGREERIKKKAGHKFQHIEYNLQRGMKIILPRSSSGVNVYVRVFRFVIRRFGFCYNFQCIYINGCVQFKWEPFRKVEETEEKKKAQN